MAKKTLEQLDPNFRISTGPGDLRWIDAFDKKLALRGLAWLEENRAQKIFRRLPDRAEGKLSEGVRELSKCPSSAFLSFFTDSRTISARWTIANTGQMNHMPPTGQSGAELYFRNGANWYPVGVAKPVSGQMENISALIENGPGILREYRLYLPLYKKLDHMEIGIERGAKISPAPAEKGARPIFFYGTSITQGGCANTAGSDFVSHVGRLLDAEVINFGFSGNGKGEPEMARLIREIDAEIFVLDYMANTTPEELKKTLPGFTRILREKHPTTPIALISSPVFDNTLWSREKYAYAHAKRDIMMEFYLKAKKAGDAHIYYIDGASLLLAGSAGAYVDGVHPTSHGFIRMAENLAPQIVAIRMREEFAT